MLILRHPFLMNGRLSCLIPCTLGFGNNRYLKRTYATAPSNSFNKIYEFPLIRAAAVVNRLKVYLSLFTIGGVPFTLVLSRLNLEFIPEGIHEPVISLGLSSCLIAYSIGFLCNRLVGAMYVNDDCTEVKISYLDSWGRRIDKICPAKDVIPLSELTDRPTDPYIKLRRYSTPENLRLSLKYGIIVDKELFESLFGELQT